MSGNILATKKHAEYYNQAKYKFVNFVNYKCQGCC